MLNIAIIIGSTRPQRVGKGVAKWIYSVAKNRSDANFELVDIKEFDLPLLDEPIAASTSRDYVQPHTKRWSQTIEKFDAYIFVTPEYNHGTSAALKNAIDYLWYEWNQKSAAFVSYGGAKGVRAVEQLKLILAEVEIVAIRQQLGLSTYTDFENYTKLIPSDRHEKSLNKVIDALIVSGETMKTVRDKAGKKAA